MEVFFSFFIYLGGYSNLHYSNHEFTRICASKLLVFLINIINFICIPLEIPIFSSKNNKDLD